MSSEILQFLIAAGLGASVAILWIVLVYRPRRTGEGEGDRETARQPEDGE